MIVTRTFRAAIRIGEDYITLEETIELPADATDNQIAQSVSLGWRIYAQQREAMEEQVNQIRGGGQPTAEYAPPPASDKQRNFITDLQDRLRWTSEQMAVFAHEQGFDLIAMTKNQASALIDALQKLAREESIIENWAKPMVTPGNVPKTPADAEQRFFNRYGNTVGGADWAAVQRYTGSRAPKPTTIEGWIAAAEAVRGKARA